MNKNSTGHVFSIDKVADEIAAGSDELTDWIRQQGGNLFLRTDQQIVGQFGQVSTWAMAQQYDPAAVHTFLQVADFYLIAHALANGHTVVSHETPSNSPKRIKIPDACSGLGLNFMTPYEMLRRERARFVLGV